MISEPVSLLRLPVLWHVRYVGSCNVCRIVGAACRFHLQGTDELQGYPEGLITNDQVRICTHHIRANSSTTQFRKHDLAYLLVN